MLFLDKKIIENAESPRRKDDPQPLDDSLQRLPECDRPGHCSQHNENHGRKCQKHVERNRLRQRDAAWKDAKHSTVESLEEC